MSGEAEAGTGLAMVSRRACLVEGGVLDDMTIIISMRVVIYILFWMCRLTLKNMILVVRMHVVSSGSVTDIRSSYISALLVC